MVYSINELPSDVLDAILRYNDDSSALTLLLTGSKAIQYKIAQGTTAITFRDRMDLALPSIPKLAFSFRSLRTLRLYRDEKAMLDHPSIGKMILELSLTLTELALAFAKSGEIFSSILRPVTSSSCPTPSVSTEAQTVKTEASGDVTFPHLQSLELCSFPLASVVLLSTLTPSLTSFKASIDVGTSVDTYVESLPRTLIRLHLSWKGWLFSSMLDRLPPHLAHLELEVAENPNALRSTSDIEKLPRSLESLKLSHSLVLTKESAAALPRSLTSISRFQLHQEPCSDILSSLPPSLTHIDVSNGGRSPISLTRRLPQGLRCFHVLSNLIDTKQLEFPSSLTILRIQSMSSIPNIISLLPRSLTTLWIARLKQRLNREDISNLPRSLLDLSCQVAEIWDDERIPFDWPKVHTLAIYNQSICSTELDVYQEPQSVKQCLFYHELPDSITNLFTSAIIPFSALKHLPPHLRNLSIIELAIDKEWDPKDPKLVSRARHLLKLGLEGNSLDDSEKSEFLSSASPDSVNFLDMLPRTLRHFEFSHKTPIVPQLEGWKRLPKFIRHLEIWGSLPLNGDVLQYLPMEHLVYLEITLNYFDVGRMRRLPRTLRFGSLNAQLQLPNTEEFARAVPHLDIQASIECEAFHALRSRRDEAIQNGDAEALKELLRP